MSFDKNADISSREHFLFVYLTTSLAYIVVADATAEKDVLGLIPESEKVLLGFSIRNLLVAAT